MPLKLDFKITDKKNWEDLIAKALKINSLDEFEYKKIAGVDIPAFNYPSKDYLQQNPLKNLHSDWKIGIPIDTSKPNAAANIMNALQNGTEALVLSGPNLDWKLLYGQVFHEMIYTDIESSEHCVPNEFIDFSIAQSKDLSLLAGSFNCNHESLKANVEAAKRLPKFHFLTGDSSSENIPDALLEISTKLKDAIKLSNELQLPISCIRATVNVGAHLPTNVSKLRSLRIIWANLLKAFGHEFEALFIKVKTTVSKEASNENALIENTSACINATLGNADLICSFQSEDQNQARLHQNIQHIMKMESNLHSVDDPLAGSYAIEKMTNHLAEACWNKLIK